MTFAIAYLIGMVISIPICFIGMKREFINDYPAEISDYFFAICTAFFFSWFWPIVLISFALKLWDDKHDNSHTSNR